MKTIKRSEIDKLDCDLSADDFGLVPGREYYIGIGYDDTHYQVLSTPFTITIDDSKYVGKFSAGNVEVDFCVECIFMVTAISGKCMVLFGPNKDKDAVIDGRVVVNGRKLPCWLYPDVSLGKLENEQSEQ